MTNFTEHKIGVVIPYYNAANHIEKVVEKLPEYIDKIIIVDDRGKEPIPDSLLYKDKFGDRIFIVRNIKNLGVGGATKTGFKKAIELELDYVLKVDADDQMDSKFIPDLLRPLLEGKAEYAKGNRFKDFKALRQMPFTRKVGNLGLSFLTKAASGYWNNFDPTNGFFAIKVELLKKLDFKNIHRDYYFESSLISELYFHEARIKDVPMPANYGDEKSNMQIWKIPFIFIPKLTKTFFKRILKSYFIYDFNIASVYLVFGFPMFLFGLVYGIYNWIHYASLGEFTPTGTIMLITVSLILGFQLLLQAIQFDISKAPKSVS
ncbi:Undecaprenyl-phosphate mannosyltransferase [Kordia antarctica]|uniref:Undecaprenyl-phosphate mannosyltransferase n=1 Tax=Kordia antarctica TaxID=1218801 RepID=A0A7L4ZFF3_9FLAO|nr:glycosyltransferase family 2 protein [Kordia antarctica]QHI35220.1 Undecaprenyl-phosphate mannosyltransferase [Kordia antarctica]